ncbi:hypothetical protein BOX15_Mlig009342g1 [Macrostomum lignano]|uniref:Uncharacterized protein n=1 Tax=Macrostomum lignano TaxID=282301 RepID=A0A267ENF6_9PLAT|nr:hypothetical protein BOX15_Mlig009342g1 [Macrostomum lignano]
MKILVVFNSVNDIVFCHADQAYLANLLAAYRGSNEAGEIAGVSRQTLDVLVQLFSPLLTTYNLMRTQQSAYRRVVLANSEEVVFRRCEDFLMIGVFGSKTFCPPAKQLANVERQLRSLVGPYFETLKHYKEGAFSLVGSMVSGWKTLFTHELAFTFSAVERVKVEGSIKAKAIESIERGFQRRRRELSGVEHVLIVCGTKLLCLYSTERTSKLVAQDFLTLISLVPALFPKFDVYDESRYKEPEGATFNSCAEPTNSSSNSDVSSAFHSCNEFVLSAPHSPRSSGLATTPERINGAFGTSQRQSTSSSGSCIELEHNAHYPLVQQIELNKSSPSESKAMLVFLNTTTSTLSPFKAHFVPMTGNVVFLALEAVEPRSVARLVDRMHRAADRALSHVSQPVDDLAAMQAAICAELHSVRRLLVELIRTLREPPGVAASFAPACERAMRDVNDHLSRAAPGSEHFRTVDLYLNAVENLLHKLKSSVMKGVFENLFLQFPFKMTATVCQAVQDLAQACRKDLQDYLPFLDVKARRNLASSSVLANYIGLVHFALVDRRSDEIVAPTPDWGRHPKGLSKRILATIGALRDAAHAVKARERDHSSSGASGSETGGEFARRKEVQLYRRDRSLQFSYLIQWEQSSADQRLLDAGFELVTVHSLEANRDTIQRHLVSLTAKFLPSRDSSDLDSGLL